MEREVVMAVDSVSGAPLKLGGAVKESKRESCGQFLMPLHYPRYSKSDYESMPEWKLDCLLSAYGLPITGSLAQRKNFAMGAFLWIH